MSFLKSRVLTKFTLQESSTPKLVKTPFFGNDGVTTKKPTSEDYSNL
jgi:hypothetical protein